jgi:SAM-dependent methyltransferase
MMLSFQSGAINTHCHLCDGTESCFIKKEGEWSIVQCKNCSFVYITPLPDSSFLYRHYQEYLPADNNRIIQWREMMSEIFKKSLDTIEESCCHKRGVLLDIGCGYGFFIDAARQRGWHVKGIELCEHARAYATSKSLEVDTKKLFDQRYKNETFDVVTLFYVLEHLPEPLKYLKEINRILKPGGLLLARVPHTTPLVKALKTFGIPNRLYDAPSHLSDFSPHTISLALEKTGFCEIRTFPGGATRPHELGKRIISCGSGLIADVLYAISGTRLLLPGVSKTTIAKKAGRSNA